MSSNFFSTYLTFIHVFRELLFANSKIFHNFAVRKVDLLYVSR